MLAGIYTSSTALLHVAARVALQAVCRGPVAPRRPLTPLFNGVDNFLEGLGLVSLELGGKNHLYSRDDGHTDVVACSVLVTIFETDDVFDEPT